MIKRVLLIGFCVRTAVAWSKPSHVAVSHEAASDSASFRSGAFVRIESILVTLKTLLADNPRYLRVKVQEFDVAFGDVIERILVDNNLFPNRLTGPELVKIFEYLKQQPVAASSVGTKHDLIFQRAQAEKIPVFSREDVGDIKESSSGEMIVLTRVLVPGPGPLPTPGEPAPLRPPA